MAPPAGHRALSSLTLLQTYGGTATFNNVLLKNSVVFGLTCSHLNDSYLNLYLLKFQQVRTRAGITAAEPPWQQSQKYLPTENSSIRRSGGNKTQNAQIHLIRRHQSNTKIFHVLAEIFTVSQFLDVSWRHRGRNCSFLSDLQFPSQFGTNFAVSQLF